MVASFFGCFSAPYSVSYFVDDCVLEALFLDVAACADSFGVNDFA